MSARTALHDLSAYGVLKDRHIASQIAVGLDGFTKHWRSEVLEFASEGGSELRFIEGQYGRGKTHLLQHLRVNSEEEGFMVCHASCGHGDAPFSSLAETYRTVAQNLSLSISGEDVVGIDKILLRVPGEALQKVQRSAMLNATFRNVAVAYARTRTSQNRNHDCIQNLRSVILGETGIRFRFSEIFKALPTLQRPVAKLGKRNAGVWLRSLFNLPRVLGYKGLVVLFDETGQDMHYSKLSLSSRREHLTNLRLLVDQMALGYLNGVVIVYAVTNDLSQQARRDYPALAQRILRVGEKDRWDRLPPNPRAIWCRLDEITNPNRQSPEFYSNLGESIIRLAREAKLSDSRIAEAKSQVDNLASKSANSLADSEVRNFVKKIATILTIKS